MKHILLLYVFVICNNTIVSAITYYSTPNSNVNNLSEWWTNTDGTGSNPGNFTSSDIFQIQAGHSCQLNGNWSLGDNASLEIYGTLTLNSSYTFELGTNHSSTVTLTIKNGGTFSNESTGNKTFWRSVTIEDGGTWTGNSGVGANNVYMYANFTNNNTSTLQTDQTQATYYTNSGNSYTWNSGSPGLSVFNVYSQRDGFIYRGNLYVRNNFTTTAQLADGAGNTHIYLTGTGTVFTANSSMYNTTNFVFHFAPSVAGSNQTISIGGTQYSPTFRFENSVNATISGGGSYFELAQSTSGIIIDNNATLNDGGKEIRFENSSTLTMNSGSNLNVTNSNTVASEKFWMYGTKTFATSSTLHISNASSTFSYANECSYSFGNLTLGTTSGASSISFQNNSLAITIKGNLSIGSNWTFGNAAANSNQVVITVQGNITNNGTYVQGTNTGSKLVLSGATAVHEISGSGTFNTNSTAPAIELNDAQGAQITSGSTITIQQLTHTNGIITNKGTLTISNAHSIPSGQTFVADNSSTTTFSNTITITGTYDARCGSVTNFNNTATNNGTIQGPTTGTWARIVNASAVNGSGSIGANSYIAFSGTLTCTKTGTNILESSGQVATCATPDISLSSSTPAIAAGTIYNGTTKQAIYSFNLAVTTANAYLSSIQFTTTNTDAADITKYQLWYNTSNDLSSASQIGSDITTSLGTGLHIFNSLDQTINAGTTGYLWITVNVSNFPTETNTIQVSAISTGNITFASGNKSGTAYDGGIQTIQGTPTINCVTTSLSDFLYCSGAGASTAQSYTISGAYLTSDIEITSPTNYEISTLSESGYTSTINLTPISGTVANTIIYVRLKAGLSDGAYNTEIITHTSSGAIQKNITCNGDVGGRMVISSENQTQSQIIYPNLQGYLLSVFQIESICNASGTISELDFTTTGTYTSSDISTFNLFYSEYPTLNDSILVSSISSGIGTHSYSFNSFNQTIDANTTGYFFITIDIASSATNTRTIQAQSITANYVTISGGIQIEGTIPEGGVKTIGGVLFGNNSSFNWTSTSDWLIACNGASANRIPTSTDSVILHCNNDLNWYEYYINTATVEIGALNIRYGKFLFNHNGGTNFTVNGSMKIDNNPAADQDDWSTQIAIGQDGINTLHVKGNIIGDRALLEFYSNANRKINLILEGNFDIGFVDLHANVEKSHFADITINGGKFQYFTAQMTDDGNKIFEIEGTVVIENNSHLQLGEYDINFDWEMGNIIIELGSTITLSQNNTITTGDLGNGDITNSGTLICECGTSITSNGTFTNNATIYGPEIGYTRFINNNSILNSGIIGQDDTNIAVSGDITGSGSVGSNVLQNSSQAATCENLLPINLISFTVTNANNCNSLQWITSSEQNNDFFTILRSDNGIDFNSIYTTSGSGNSNSINTYSYLDCIENNGIAYYILEQTDYDGKTSRSQIISTYNFQKKFTIEKISLYPSARMYIVFDDTKTSNQISIIDMNGKLLFSEIFMLEKKIEIPLQWSKGTYIITHTKNCISQSIPFIIH